MIKFGLVGALCFMIDYGLYSVLCLSGMYYLLAALIGFTVSVVVNYLLSMKFVFTRKDNMNRKAEFTIFLVLSIIGLGLNEVIIYACYDGLYLHVVEVREMMSADAAKLIGKLVATAIVMIFNFITRKIFLEKKEK